MRLLGDKEIKNRIDTIMGIPFFKADDLYLCRDIAESQLNACKEQVKDKQEEVENIIWDYLNPQEGDVDITAEKIIQYLIGEAKDERN